MKHFFLSHRSTQIALSLVALFTLTLFGSTAAFADTITGGDPSATINGVTGVTNSATFTPLTSPHITLDGTDQTIALGTLDVNPIDYTGSGTGWTVSASATQPQTNDITPIPLAAYPKLANTGTGHLALAKADTGTTVTTGMTLADLTLNSDSSGQALLSAAPGSGMGAYTFTDVVSITIPANSYAGTYSTTISLDTAAL